MDVRPWKVVDGRSLDPVDIKEGANHCLIGRQLSEREGWQVGQPLGIKDQYFTIVGIIDAGAGDAASTTESSMGGLHPGENLVVVPGTIPPYWLDDRNKPAEQFDVVYLKLSGGASASEAVRRCEAVLQHPMDQASQFSYITPDSLVLHLRRLQKMIQVSAGSLALLCLVLGGTTLASLMIANVQERVREIGLRLALGASEWSIGGLFMVEAMVLTLIAGVIGTTLAHAGLWWGLAQLPVPVKLTTFTLFAPVVFAVVFGVFCAWWPARKAARVRPADALRNE